MELAAAYTSLNAGQRAAFDAVMDGHNVFITGPGGTGKSYLIKAIVATMPKERHTAVVALTGCAALLLGCGAKTLHSWAGIGLGKESADALVAAIKKKTWKPALRNWLRTKTLIIDECSMMQPELLEKLDIIGRRIRGSVAPFGGMQVLFFGDFYQLPPVDRTAVGTKFLFQSAQWPEIVDKTIQLTEIVRQADPAFQDLLNAARRGSLKDEHIATLQSRCDLPWREEVIRPTLLFSRRAEVDMINSANLESLEGELQKYGVATVVDAEMGGGRHNMSDAGTKAAIEGQDKDAAYDTELTLRVGAQVMLIYNLDPGEGLVNGSRGVVRRFVQVPGGETLPVVLFKNGKEIAVARAKWELEDFKGVYRSQVPLRLAYAITIHKCQGSTLDSAMVDIGQNVFEFGQAYVALSRVKSLESLYVWQLDPRAVKAHPLVRAFYDGLAASQPERQSQPEAADEPSNPT